MALIKGAQYEWSKGGHPGPVRRLYVQQRDIDKVIRQRICGVQNVGVVENGPDDKVVASNWSVILKKKRRLFLEFRYDRRTYTFWL